ncbi:hypothetical protein RRSWK_03724 [Rhodopirellula sp. SWK7]|nr:hypothetical protein RRSWK_03724 [Rhodopirellula sp. SWK7]
MDESNHKTPQSHESREAIIIIADQWISAPAKPVRSIFDGVVSIPQTNCL